MLPMMVILTLTTESQDVFTTLSFRGIICIPSESQRLDDLTKAMASLQVNFATLTSTVAGLLKPAEIPSMREGTLVLVGEAVKPMVVESWLGHTTLLSALGHSE